MEQEILKLEQICAAMYQTGDTNMRQQAQKVLVDLVNDVHVLQKCQLLLQRGVSPYSLLIASSTLTKRVTKPGTPLSMQERLDIKNYVLNFLYNGAKQPPFVEEEISLLYARITKLSWFDSVKDEFFFRNVIQDISKFLQGSTENCIIGVNLLNHLVADMNRLDNVRPLTRHRKIAASFRDQSLFEIFQLACQMLSQALATGVQVQGSDQFKLLKIKTIITNWLDLCALLSAVLQLTLTCLTFDFIGTSYDESGDDLGTVQIPTGWRSAFVDLSTSQLFLNLYNVLPVSLCKNVVSCLVQIVSVRRSLFNSSERTKFLADVMSGTKGILENPQKLSDETTFHEFCRMLARLKANYQLGELVKVACYPECIQLIANFTVTSLRMWHFSPNSIHYLLSLWQRMAASVPYVKAQEPHHLENYMPEVLKAYVESRLDSVEIILRDELENPLEDMSFIKQQLEQISAIARCEYAATCRLLVQLFDDVASQLEKLLLGNVDNQQLLLPMGKLTWIIHLVGAVIGGRVSFAATDDHDSMDGELVIRVLQLMAATDRRLPSGNGFVVIELAFLSFFEQFRKIYVGDQVQKTSKLYKRLSDSLQLGDDLAVLSVFVSKIITNLKYWSHNDEIISRTLHLLSDLSIGFSSVRKLVKLEAVQFLLDDNPTKHFPFLGVDSKISDLRCRTTFYTSLGRLLMVELGEDEERFLRFMSPMAVTFQSLEQMVQTTNSSGINNRAIRTLIGVTRDCRGLAYAFNTKNSYAMLYDLICPTFVNILQKAVEIWYADPALTTPILKLFTELVLNRGQRLSFDVSSPNGILLFKEASKLVCTYGTRLLSVGEPPKQQLYSHRLKGISLSFKLLKNALSGGYVNFSVFRLYNDSTLDDALHVFINLVMCVEASHLLDFPKLSQSYHSLLEVVMQDHMKFITGLPSSVVYHLLESITAGFSALDTGVCTCCCTAMDYFVTFLFRIASRSNSFTGGKGPALPTATTTRHRDDIERQREQHFLQIMHERPEILQKALSTVLHTIMFEDCKNQWSMSRPLLGLILLNEEYLGSIEKSLCSPSLDHGRLDPESVSNIFRQLMNGVDKNLHTKTRDRFTQNLSMFRRDIHDVIKTQSNRSPPNGECLDLTVNSSRMMT